ncbi:MAG: LysR family transcriptional regulator [Syntrophobacterales bacterium]|nr:LysR family transcriptional regulator [Syntrophobacterales bacterium]
MAYAENGLIQVRRDVNNLFGLRRRRPREGIAPGNNVILNLCLLKGFEIDRLDTTPGWRCLPLRRVGRPDEARNLFWNRRAAIMKIRYKIWLEQDGKVIFGKGRDELFRAIQECRSLQAAAKELKMSYRAAWGRLKASEERLGIKLVENDGAKKGLRLTAEARELLEQYEQFEKDLKNFLQKKSKALGWDRDVER